MLQIILVLNQLEREQICEATKQRLAAARAAGKRLGYPSVGTCYKYADGLHKTPGARAWRLMVQS